MSFTNWFRNTQSSPRLEAVIAKTVTYLKTQADDGYILPRIVGKAIGESEVTATTALRILEERGVTKQHFRAYCAKTHAPLDAKDDLQKIEPAPYCEICDEEHSLADETCKIEVYYSVNRGQLERYEARISAA
jgi:hypothetical protein